MGLLGHHGLLRRRRPRHRRLFREDALAETLTCFLCGRPLGRRVEWHHPVPKSRGGRETVPIHPICHRTIHAVIDNKALGRDYATPAELRSHPDIAKFLDWVKSKPPDFHAPTRRRKG